MFAGYLTRTTCRWFVILSKQCNWKTLRSIVSFCVKFIIEKVVKMHKFMCCYYYLMNAQHAQGYLKKWCNQTAAAVILIISIKLVFSTTPTHLVWPKMWWVSEIKLVYLYRNVVFDIKSYKFIRFFFTSTHFFKFNINLCKLPLKIENRM